MTRLVQLTSFDRPRSPWAVWRKEIIPLPPERVWKALTTEEELTRWWCERASVDLHIGGHYLFQGSNVYGLGVATEPKYRASEVGDEDAELRSHGTRRGGLEGPAWAPSGGGREARSPHERGELDGVRAPGIDFGNESAARRTEETTSSLESCEITELVPNERLAFKWPLLGVATTVTYELSNLLELTELRVTHTAREAPGGWPFGPDRPNWWWIALPALRTHLENGRVAVAIDYTADHDEPAARFVTDVTTFPWIIWSKLTRAEELAKWWGRQVEIGLQPGGTFKLGLEAGPEKIVEVEEERRVVHDWIWSDGTRSFVEWTIEETDDATRVTLTDRGPWAPDAHRDARRIHWASTLLHLKQMSEKGITPRDYQDP